MKSTMKTANNKSWRTGSTGKKDNNSNRRKQQIKPVSKIITKEK